MKTVRAPARTFQELEVWRRAHEFALGVYGCSMGFPKTETYGLITQFRRAAVSIPANIAEGFRKKGRSDKARFMNIAQASLEECRYYLILSRDLDYGDNESLWPILEEVSRMLDAYAKAILTPAS